MSIQIIVTGTKRGYYSKFKTLHDRVLDRVLILMVTLHCIKLL